jgi:phenylacetic acid degradation operon negative regulatory protein
MTPLERTLLRLERPPRTASLIVTAWGDAVVPRGGSLWLGTLQAILGRFGCNEGQVRTAMSRLTEEGWLRRTRQGRLSFYRLGPRGEESFVAAARRIYYLPRAGLAPWDGRFRVALGPGDDPALAARGFVPLAPGVLITADAAAAEDLPASLPVLLAQPRGPADAAAVAHRAWPSLVEIAVGYARFAETFAPLLDMREPVPLEADALPLRLLLVHEYRRVALRDPDLPPALLPADWTGPSARTLAAALYRRLLPASEAWLTAHGAAEEGALPPPAPGVLEARFRDT